MLGQTQTSLSTSLNATPVPAIVEDGFNAINDVQRVIEGGTSILTSNPSKAFSVSLANNLREKSAIGYFGSISLGIGDCAVTGSITTYFETKALVDKYRNQVKTSVGNIYQKDNKAVVIFLPTVKITSASTVAGGRNQDVEATLNYTAQKDNNQLYSIQIDMFNYIQE